jgi:prepilin-type N-terminal cleavage/methylation domain-containing protein
MKRKIRGFTLVELIVVMAIITILTAGILRLFAPIRNSYRDATYYQTKRDACNSISRYITESVRYAQYIGVYSSSEVGTDNTGAVKAAQNLLDSLSNATTGFNLPKEQINAIGPKIKVIEIDYSANNSGNYSSKFGNRVYSGRLWRYNFSSPSAYANTSTDAVAGRYNSPSDSHMVLGKAYYGDSSFGIKVTYDNNLLSVTAATQSTSSITPADAVTDSNDIIKTDAAVKLQNVLSLGRFYGTDTKKWNDTHTSLINDANGDNIPDILQTGTSSNGSKGQYFFAFINAEDYPS